MSQPTSLDNRPQRVLQGYLDALLLDAFLELPTAEVAPAVAPVVVPAEPIASVSEDEFAAAVREELERDAARQPRVVPLTARRAGVALAERSPAEVLLPVTLPVAAPDTDIELDWRVPELAPVAEPPRPIVEGIAVGNVPSPSLLVGGAPPGGVALEGRPEWGEEPFECLLFDVAGLTLAAPLVCLGSIYPLADEELTPLFGQPDWFLGLLPCQAGNLRVLDAARWVMPERYRDDYREGLKFVISLQGLDWGLAVHGVSHSVRLDPAEVKWRNQRATRPWLAGTVIDQMCALLDVAALAEQVVGGRR
ncbi:MULTISPECIES: chemotaxis protein CheW [Pseudomonas]|uniref:Chemotaxis protein CheW n=1 Tax=Pseudomonas oryzihabitans TaxID=47885 RepID=A0A0U4VQE1_9PSED|nr:MULTISPECIES: chemotaxis protein CheW [Pseudomonas]ALZ85371.1 chemotaxis protein CheW [Pseudomonas oryzihabitans]WCE10267.1 chemotaxis protein CheW [Pseudomonas sp. JBR1]HAC67720.1 chemotaxis protein CheW [Pseudomonas sp.]